MRPSASCPCLDHPPVNFLIGVWWTSARPIVDDEHLAAVWVSAHDERDATLAAAQMVAARHQQCQMPTRTAVFACRAG